MFQGVLWYGEASTHAAKRTLRSQPRTYPVDKIFPPRKPWLTTIEDNLCNHDWNRDIDEEKDLEVKISLGPITAGTKKLGITSSYCTPGHTASALDYS